MHNIFNRELDLHAMDSLDETILKYALQNAVGYNGKASPGSVIGRVLAEKPEMKARAKDINQAVMRIIKEVNALTPDQQREKLAAIAPELLVKEKKEREFKLPELPNVKGSVVMRFAPNPSGPLHIGHSRVVMLTDEYVKRYGGKFINRFEDTDPARVDPSAYDIILEDLQWLGAKVDETYYQSDRMKAYYDLAKQLLVKGQAYMCNCKLESWRELKEKGIACPHRDAKPEEQMELWDKMFDGTLAPEEASLIIKTNLKDPNPALRDYPALRIEDTPHPRTGTKYRVYPLMNFAVAVDDHLLGLTHVLRGKDHLNNTYRQYYIFDYFGWTRPVFMHYGRVSIVGPELSTSKMSKGIREGIYTGWDDPRLGALRALARRGFKQEALREYWIRAGLNEVDVEFSWETFFSLNKDLIDPIAKRYFFVAEPVALQIEGVDHLEGKAPLHPSDKSLGFRTYSLQKPIKVSISKADSSPSMKVRLKDLCNIDVEGGKAKYAGNDIAAIKQGYKIIHWTPIDSPPMTVLMPDGIKVCGMGEKGLLGEKGNVVQLERFGFVKIESVGKEIFAVFAQR
jgi:glutamyl-tRNA synthetase